MLVWQWRQIQSTRLQDRGYTFFYLLFFCFFLFLIRAPGTQTTWNLLEEKCLSPASCRRSFILIPKVRTAALTCWAPSKASALARRSSKEGNAAGRPLLHQQPAESSDRRVIGGATEAPPPSGCHFNILHTNSCYTIMSSEDYSCLITLICQIIL